MWIAVVDRRKLVRFPQIVTTSVAECVLDRAFSLAPRAEAEQLDPAVAAETGSVPILEVTVPAFHLSTPETENY
jgi:hypothetical protein